ncbi:hypothetical protein [Streptomyces sp. YU58]|uniref:hypothetical protein n=1 Tax=Streptomyces sp. SX92 TaxID=3158972 RepID=UPI0027B884F4|nr:hypothetical protein [Streptomyces coralus]WLW57707.1 hypothetical protein QU709_42875 [Streptomyces coralus]
MVFLVVRPSTRTGTRLTTASLAAAVLAGCVSAQPAARPAAPSPLPRPPAFTGRPSPSAVDLATHSGSWPSTERILRTALNRLVGACMAERGFRHPAGSGDSPVLRAPEDERAAVDLPGRRRTGYGIAAPSALRPREPSSPVDAYYRGLTPDRQRRFDEALNGPPGSRHRVGGTDWGDVLIPREGCEARGRSALAGDGVLWARITYVPEKYDNDLAARISAHPAYRGALETWRTCMQARVYGYSDPDDIVPALERRFRAAGPSPGHSPEFNKLEKATAVADGECALESHVPAVALTVQRALVSELPPNNLRTLAELAHHRDEAVRRARAVLKGTAQSSSSSSGS